MKSSYAFQDEKCYNPLSELFFVHSSFVAESDNAIKVTKITMMSSDDTEILTEADSDGSVSKHTPCQGGNKRAIFAVLILFFVNLLNYMDRFTIAGVLTKVQNYFYDISDAQAGLLQTVFVCSFMIFAPLFGYLGDRYPRKIVMSVGIFIWSITVLGSTFVRRDQFGVFLFCRGVVGIGEASYTTVAPTIIADLFAKDMRSRMLMLFYFAIPLGSGLGFVVGANVADALDEWQWGVRVTPLLGAVCLVLIVFVLKEPARGESENSHTVATSWWNDIYHIVKTRSFLWSTLGFTCVAFVAGSLSWWAPTFVVYSQKMGGHNASNAHISLIFGIITCLAGFFGVGVGATWSQFWRRTNPRADPLICGIGLLLCVPFLFLALVIVQYNLTAAWPCMFLAIFGLCLNWSIVSDLLLYIMIPTRRATASAIQILISHLLGDATSPYIVGQISDAVSKGSDDPKDQFFALQYAMFVPTFICVLGGFFFLGCAWYIEHDRKKADAVAHSNLPENQTLPQLPVASSEPDVPTVGFAGYQQRQPNNTRQQGAFTPIEGANIAS